MRTHLRLKNRHALKLPSPFHEEDVRYADDLVAEFVRRFTQPGDTVFDPFAGFGTTLRVAEAMDRMAWGVEFDAARVQYIRSLLRHPERLINGDARQLAAYSLPMFDLSMTSPPFMGEHDPEDPLTNYSTRGAGYQAYLDTLQHIYAQVRQLMKPEARVVIEVSNLKEAAGVTTLAWDVGRAVSEVLRFEGETVICWDKYNYGYDHSYCLVFRA